MSHYGNRAAGTEWSRNDDDILRQCWGKMPGSKIGELLGGRTKCSVLGRGHRLGLPRLAVPGERLTPAERASRPRVKRKSPTRQRRIPNGVPTLRALQSLQEMVDQHKSRAVVAPEPAPRPAPERKSPKHTCQWPLGHPGTPSFKFCDDPTEYGKPYCPKHRKIAYAPRGRPAW